MPTHQICLTEARPFFAELPYYLWGQVNYDSEGDCRSPTDRSWSCLEVTNRDTDESLEIAEKEGVWEITGDDPLAARAAFFLVSRSGGHWVGLPPDEELRSWDHDRASLRADRVRTEFERPELKPFDVGHLFWGSWKWIGWFGTHFTWVGRWIMDSVVRKDDRAVGLCIHWLREGTFSEPQSHALRYALNTFTGREFPTDEEWVHWYDQGGGIQQYPEPDIDQWYEELRAHFIIE